MAVDQALFLRSDSFDVNISNIMAKTKQKKNEEKLIETSK